MFLSVLVFFGSAVAGAWLSHFFPSKGKKTGAQLLGVLAYGVAFELVAFNMPFRSSWLETLCVVGGTVGLGLVFWVMGSTRPDSPGPVTGAGCLFALVVPLFPIVSFTTVGRVAHAQKMAQRIDGVVALRYRSDNHSAPSISVAGNDGAAVDIEGVDEGMWNVVSPGRSRLTKPAWSASGELDGKVVRVVPRSYVLFIGPFRD